MSWKWCSAAIDRMRCFVLFADQRAVVQSARDGRLRDAGQTGDVGNRVDARSQSLQPVARCSCSSACAGAHRATDPAVGFDRSLRCSLGSPDWRSLQSFCSELDPGTRKLRRPRRLEQSVGARLRSLRVARRLTLRETALRASLSESFLSQLERGQTGATIQSLQRIAAALGVDVSDLFAPADSGRPRVVRRDGRQLVAWGTLGRKALLTPEAVRVARGRRGRVRGGRLHRRRRLHARRLRGAVRRRRRAASRSSSTAR